MAYLDNILIYSKDSLKYKAYIKKVLDQLQAMGLQANIKKSEFGVTQTKYLRFIISIDSIEVDLSKTEVVYNQKELKTVKGIQSFLGFYNFY